jgi:hypothetical protein
MKVERGCADCGERHPACLEWHHLDPREKDGTVSRMMQNCVRWEAILAEVKKCVVLCSNCHRKRHWEERPTTFADTETKLRWVSEARATVAASSTELRRRERPGNILTLNKQ